jgi:hypothetical protein
MGSAAKFIALGVVGLALLPSCSFIFTKPAANSEGIPNKDCTTSRAPPVLDTLLTISNLAAVVYVAAQDNVSNKGQAMGAGVAVASMWFFSALYGYRNTKACEGSPEETDYGDLSSDPEPDPDSRRKRSVRPTSDPGLTHRN